MRRGYQVALGVAIFAAVYVNAVAVRYAALERSAGGILPMPAHRANRLTYRPTERVAGAAWK